MKIARVEHRGRIFHGVIDGEVIRALRRDPFSGEGGYRDPEELVDEGSCVNRAEVRLLPPCVPGKYIGIGVNYRETGRMMGMAIPDEPLVFVRPTSCIVATGEDIVLPPGAEVVSEGELAVVIGRRGRHVDEEEAGELIFGYTLTNDLMSVTRYHLDGGNPTLAKGYDSFAPLGPHIVTDRLEEGCELATWLNGEQVQGGHSSDMIFSIRRCISHVSRFMTLMPGDIIATGCPPVPVRISAGDRIEVRADGLGPLVNRVVAAPDGIDETRI